MIDAHAHLDFDVLHDSLEQVLLDASAAGVEAIICAGYDLAHHARAHTLRAHSGLYLATGLHPWAVSALDQPSLARSLDALAAHLGAETWCAVGECGLDYHKATTPDARALQREAFIQQLSLARAHHLPAIVHAVKCHDDLLGILAHHMPERGVQLHGYSGHASLVPRLHALGATFSFGTPLTWQGQARIKDALRAAVACDGSCWMLETDAPDRPVAGAPGEGHPAHLEAVARAAAEILGWQVDEVMRVSGCNAGRFFCVSHRIGEEARDA